MLLCSLNERYGDNMKVIGNTSSKILNGLNEIGDKVTSSVKSTKVFLENKKDTFVKSDTYKNLSSKVDKKTVVGAGIVVAALILAAKCLKGVFNRVSEFKN